PGRRTRAGGGIGAQHHVRYVAARGGGTLGAPAPAPSPPPIPPSAPTPPPTSPAPAAADSTKHAAPAAYSVQVLAVKSAVQVDELLTRLKGMGYADARVVRDTSGFLKVRGGSDPTRQDAQRAPQRLHTRPGCSPRGIAWRSASRSKTPGSPKAWCAVQ